MTGFKLTWRIEKPTLMSNISGEVIRNTNANFAQNNHDNSTRLSHHWLVNMVHLARYLRIKENMTEEQILNKVIQEKLKNMSTLEEPGICSNDQIQSHSIDQTFNNLMACVEMKELDVLATDEDKTTGFEIYHVLVYCPVMNMKLYKFVYHLLSSESIRTIIRSYTNLFHSGVLKGTTSITLAKAFYLDLVATLNLQYDNIMLATSTKSQLEAMRDNDWPFSKNNNAFDWKCDSPHEIKRELGNFIVLGSFFKEFLINF